MATERTLSIIKPDATRRNLTGKVNAVIEDAGLRIPTEVAIVGIDDYLLSVGAIKKYVSGVDTNLEKNAEEVKNTSLRHRLEAHRANPTCASCHKIGYVGGLVGPDLTKIGGIRTERDLLQAAMRDS